MVDELVVVVDLVWLFLLLSACFLQFFLPPSRITTYKFLRKPIPSCCVARVEQYFHSSALFAGSTVYDVRLKHISVMFKFLMEEICRTVTHLFHWQTPEKAIFVCVLLPADKFQPKVILFPPNFLRQKLNNIFLSYILPCLALNQLISVYIFLLLQINHA